MRKKLKIFFIFSFVALVASFGLAKIFLLRSEKPPETIVAETKDSLKQIEESILSLESNEKSRREKQAEEGKLPDKVIIKVPFIVQAPFGIWDERHQEACEEASLIMIYAHLNERELDKEQAEKEIQAMIDFQLKRYGAHKDLDVEQSIKLFSDYYGSPVSGKKLKAVYDFTQDDLRRELADGHPVILPAAGRKLNNPYFRQPGPLYHMLVVIGYSGNDFITNDPGTRRGRGYRYDAQVLYSAIHDFPGKKEEIEKGRKAMIVIEDADR